MQGSTVFATLKTKENDLIKWTEKSFTCLGIILGSWLHLLQWKLLALCVKNDLLNFGYVWLGWYAIAFEYMYKVFIYWTTAIISCSKTLDAYFFHNWRFTFMMFK